MLIDLPRWRGLRVAERVGAFTVEHPERCAYYDQCALNWGLPDDWAPLDTRWNHFPVLHDLATAYGALPPTPYKPAVCHYISSMKPWKAVTPPSLIAHNLWYLDAARDSP